MNSSINLRRRDTPASQQPPATLVARYSAADLSLFTEDELKRLSPSGAREWSQVEKDLAWEILYRKEPALYERLIAGERLHPAIFDWLPPSVDRAVEIGPGSGRLTIPLSARCGELVAVEPATPMRDLLKERLESQQISNVRLVPGFFDSLAVPEEWSDLTISCSSFTPHESHGGKRGLTEMERVTRRGGLVVIVWPGDTEWLQSQGFQPVSFDGGLQVEFQSVQDAVELAEIFYPWAAARIKADKMQSVPYDMLEMSPPNTLSWRQRR